MQLSREMFNIGRRNFLKAVAGTTALAALGTTAVVRGPKSGGPVRAALIGYGKQGRVLAGCIDANLMDLKAICDIRPASKDDLAANTGVHWYQDWRRLLEQEKIEAVLIATPPATHAEIAVACLKAGKHVFCETAMATDANGCRQMIEAAQKSGRILKIGYQDFYESRYGSAYKNIMKPGILGDVYAVEAVWHKDGSGRVVATPDVQKFDPRPWGYASLDEYLNWHLYQRTSAGPVLEEGGALISTTNWFLDAVPVAVQGVGNLYSYKDGRDVNDHVYAMLEYPNGRTVMLSVIQSNGFDGSYVQFMGTKGTLILTQGEALLFPEGQVKSSSVSTAAVGGSKPVVNASASKSEASSDHPVLGGGEGQTDRTEAFQNEIAAFCGAVRVGASLHGSAEQASNTALTCFAVNDAIAQKKRVSLQGLQASSQSLVPALDDLLHA